MRSNIYSPLLTINMPYFGSRAIGHFCRIQKLKIEIRKELPGMHVRYYVLYLEYKMCNLGTLMHMTDIMQVDNRGFY